MEVKCHVSLGELVDKMTILKIKTEKISDPQRSKLAKEEFQVLEKTLKDLKLDEIASHFDDLKSVNESLWEIEDDIRECEANQDFSEKFIALARSVYKTNDERFKLKNSINIKYNSQIKEVKSYEDY